MENPKEKGRMVRALERFAPLIGGHTPLQFRLDAKRPDLTKLDVILGLLAAQTNFFELQVAALEETLRTGRGTAAAVAKLGELVPAQLPEEATVATESTVADPAGESKGKQKVENRPTEVVRGDVPDEFLCPITNDMSEAFWSGEQRSSRPSL